MRQEIYQWMKNLAFFHVLTTAILHILPDSHLEGTTGFALAATDAQVFVSLDRGVPRIDGNPDFWGKMFTHRGTFFIFRFSVPSIIGRTR